MTVIAFFLILFLGACQQAPTPAPTETAKPDNPVTRYVDGLQNSETKARAVAGQANERIAEQNKTLEIE